MFGHGSMLDLHSTNVLTLQISTLSPSDLNLPSSTAFLFYTCFHRISSISPRIVVNVSSRHYEMVLEGIISHDLVSSQGNKACVYAESGKNIALQ